MIRKALEKVKNINIKNTDKDFVTKIIYNLFVLFILVMTIWVCVGSPTQPHFGALGNNTVWFGENWYYVNSDSSKRDNTPVESQLEHYIRLKTDNGQVTITKILDFTPKEDEFMCFRAKSQDVTVYVNGEVWYERHYQEAYRSYTKTMYLLHQFSVYGLKAGDRITINLSTVENYTSLHFISIGDRYAITKYILKKSRNSVAVCTIAIIMVIINIITSYSPIFTDKRHDTISLKWLTSFLCCAIVYISTDSGAMELFIEKNSVVSWLSNISLLMLPMPFILFTRDTFFPGHKRYNVLATINFLLTIWCVFAYTVLAIGFSNFYMCVHLIVAVGMVMCIISFIEEKMIPAPEVIIGYGSVIGCALLSIVCYWKAIIYPASTAFGIGLLIFCICMLIWIIRSRHEFNKMREEADHVIMQRDKQAAEQASEQKSRFLSHMSHEIRTPLNAMLGMNELIMHETDYEQIRKYSLNLQSAGRTLLALINDVLDFSKIETGKMDIVESDYSLSSTLNDVVLMTQTRATDKGLDYRLDVDSSLPDVLRGDEVRVKQIMVNIMTNAIKYTKEGYIELAVYSSEHSNFLDEDTLNLIIRVTDTGIGIKQDDMKKLFTEFERLDRNKNNNIEGTGLGLSITSRLVELMHGKIDVKSEYGKGSTFTVTIPQTIVSNVPIGDYKKRFDILTNENEKKEMQSLENMKFTGKRVYVVDDNEMNLEVIASILELLEIHVEKAGGGKEAMEHLDHNSYDLILTDDMMPEVGGTELMQYLHNNKESASNKTPIVVLTANAVAGAREEYINKGFDDYLTKPIDIDVLQKILVTYLG
jgi:signal transduction histidine kinase/ActR/RegA family two-component response regulator